MKLVPICILGVIAFLQFTDPALAVTSTSAKASASETARDLKISTLNLNRNQSDEDAGQAGEPIEVLASPDELIQGDAHSFAIASANARIGHLGVTVAGGSLGGEVARGSSSAAASAVWLDTLTISSRSRSALRTVFNVFLDADLTASATGAASAGASFVITNPAGSRLVFPGTTIEGAVFEVPSAGIHQFDEAPGAFRVELFPPDGPFTIGLGIALNGAATSNVSEKEGEWKDDIASYSGEISHSLTWGGLEGVFDRFTGEKLDDWTISSETGFDYSRTFDAQVPEPTSTALLSCGLWALLGQTMIRNRRN